MDDSPSNRYHSEGPNNGTIVNLNSQEAAGIMAVHRPDLEGADSREKRGGGREREVGGFKTVAEGKVKPGEEEENDSVSSDSSEEDEEVDEHRLLSASVHAKAAAAVLVRGGAGGGGKSTGIAVAQSDHMEYVILFFNLAAGGASVNRASLSDSWNDDDLDPFSYGPPLTKWDYLKVSLSLIARVSQIVSGSLYKYA